MFNKWYLLNMTPFEQREAFHLLFFAAFAERFVGRAYALKGGVCLRFYHRSPRLSEDMDMDIGNISAVTLRKGVEGVMGRSSFTSSLGSLGIVRMAWRTAKSTDTAQRWNLSLEMGGDAPPILTRLECSRRRSAIPYVMGVPAPDLLARYGYRPFSGQFYSVNEMVHQKIDALASVRRHALRDLFDLDFLFAHGGGIVPAEVEGSVRQAAVKKISSMTRPQFTADVLPYLSQESRSSYEVPAEFNQVVQRVQKRLTP